MQPLGVGIWNFVWTIVSTAMIIGMEGHVAGGGYLFLVYREPFG